MEKIKVAILGQGRSGWGIHATHLLTDTDRFQVMAVADPIEVRRTKAVEAFGCAAYEDYSDIYSLKDIDLVVNALPSHLHVPVTLEFLQRGFNVLSEKPAARTVAEMDALMAAAEKSGAMYAIFQQSRLALHFFKIMEIIESGKLGRLVEIKIRYNGYSRRWDWQTCQQFNGGNLLNNGPHPLDQALHIMNVVDMPTVFCKMDRVNTFGDAEDFVKLILSAPNTPLVDIEVSSCAVYPTDMYTIMGDRGGLRASTTSVDWQYYDAENAPTQEWIEKPLADAEGNPIYCKEELQWTEEHWEHDDPKDTWVGATARLYTNLVEHLLQGAPLVVTPDEVRQQIAVIEEAHRQNPLSRMSE
ncbi:MAG: Gfo/Idh/MocA family oxidoreductase [Anaerolineae bacterium]|jgi:predicted dehydrogenase|nr:Gfo/Idh/MocA family oxidoreductase [Anaerolineae bacterium]